MDAVKFIEERNRMCATYTPKRCEGCPADNYGEEGVACIMADKIDAERLVPIVESWSAAHPRKTRQSVFLEQWPDAPLNTMGVLFVCPLTLCGDNVCPKKNEDKLIMCEDCRREFWMMEVE